MSLDNTQKLDVAFLTLNSVFKPSQIFDNRKILTFLSLDSNLSRHKKASSSIGTPNRLSCTSSYIIPRKWETNISNSHTKH